MAIENIPGLSIAIIDGDTVTTRSYGVKKAGRPDPVNVDTAFEAASLTKPITSLVALRMWEEGLLDLDKPLSGYTEYDDISHDARHHAITARMVLGHTTGLPNARAREGLEIYADPGERFGYSGEAFRYLQAAIEAAAGESLDRLAIDYLFDPLDMRNSSLIWRESFGDNAASGHTVDGDFEREIYQLPRAYPEGGLVTTIQDYARFAKYILDAHQRSASTMMETFSPVVTAADYGGEGSISWGLGWGLDFSVDRKRAWHTGANGAFTSFMVLDLESQKGVVAFTNSANGLNILPDVVRQAIGDPYLAEHYQSSIRDIRESIRQ